MKEQNDMIETFKRWGKDDEANQLILEDVSIECLEMYGLKVVIFWKALDITKYRSGKKLYGYGVQIEPDSIKQNLVLIYYPRDKKENLLVNSIIPEDEHPRVLSEIGEYLVDNKKIDLYVFDSEEPDCISIWKEKEDR